MESIWYLYILRCKDGTLYTGITTDVEKRLEAHRTGRGAKYTRGRAPLTLRYREAAPDKSSALKREFAIKRLRRPEKAALIFTYGSKNKELLAIYGEKEYTEHKYMETPCHDGKEEKPL